MRRVAAPPGEGYRQAAATRRRLLDAAVRTFAERGYRQGTLREICRRAGVNGAMANYHFGSKSALHRAALREAFRRHRREAPVETGLDAPTTPGEGRARLVEVVHGMTRGLLARRGAPHSMLLLRELAEPTTALDEIVEELVRPRFAALRDALRAIDPSLPERQATWIAMAVVAQVAYHRTAGPIALRLLGARAYGPAVVREIVETVLSFVDRALGSGAVAGGDVA
jgi:AcrR family transcriptional regulator